MPQPEIEELLEDSTLVMRYAVRVGRLPDETLLTAIDNVRSASAADAPRAVPALLLALNNAVRAIGPMTLAELRDRLSPFDARGQRRLKRAQLFFSVLTIFLVALVADLTEYLHRADTALKAFQEIEATRPLNKLNALRKMVQIDSVLTKRDPIHYEQFQRSVTELRDLQNRLLGSWQVVNDVQHRGPYLSRAVQLMIDTLSDSWGAFAAIFRSAPQAKSKTDTAGVQRALWSYEEASTAGDNRTITDACDSSALSGMKTYPPWLKPLAADLLEDICFSTRLNLQLALPSTTSLFFGIQTSMAALNGWVLPFLYGLLGASVYVMRNLLDPRTPTLGFAPALLRVSLGGIAGIIIGWFSLSTGAKADLASISVWPFGLAFCGGFSIEILFSLLDRINRTIGDSSTPQGVQTQ